MSNHCFNEQANSFFILLGFSYKFTSESFVFKTKETKYVKNSAGFQKMFTNINVFNQDDFIHFKMNTCTKVRDKLPSAMNPFTLAIIIQVF